MKASCICFLTGGRELCSFGFYSKAGNPIIDDNFAGFNNFQGQTQERDLMRLVTEEKTTEA